MAVQQQQAQGNNRFGSNAGNNSNLNPDMSHRKYCYRRRPQQRARAGSDATADTSSLSSSSESSHHGKRNNRRSEQEQHNRPRHVQVFTEEQIQQYLALDCEMVGVGADGRQSALARVTIIDWHGSVLMDELVQQQQVVTDYRTFVSGITAEDLDRAELDFATCQQRVQQLLKGKVLVGHGLKSDLRVLGITHPWYNTRDTAKYEPFQQVRFDDGVLWPRSLKDLCRVHLNRDVQVQGQPHCPHEDALAALDLYRHVSSQWEKAMQYKLAKTRAIEQHRLQGQHVAPAWVAPSLA